VRRATFLLLLAALACAPRPEAPAWPAGWLLSADRAALAEALDTLARLQGTPAGRLAAELRARLPECAALEAAAEGDDPRALFASLRCAEPQGALAAFHAARGAHDLLFAAPGQPGLRAHGHADFESGGAQLALAWPLRDDEWAGLLPGAEPAAPERLAAAERVAHARARSAGPLDLAALVPAGSQGDRLFALRSGLFSAALLDGSVELALYLPEPGAGMPRIVAALGVRQQQAARTAAELFLDELEASWSLRRTPFAAGDARGACLPDLHLLPELAPCYALRGDALLAGWNAASLRHALATEGAPDAGARADGGPPAQAASAASPAQLDVDLEGVAAADLRLAAQRGTDAAPLRWPWRRLHATAGRRDGRLLLELTLLPSDGSRS
jgi:hypothetical protein